MISLSWNMHLNGGAGPNNDANFYKPLIWVGGVAISAITSFALYNMYANAQYYTALEKEPAENINHYLRDAEFTLTRIESGKHMQEWTSGIDSQKTFRYSVEEFKQSGEALSVLSDLGQVSSQLLNHDFKENVHRAGFLSKKYQMYQGKCLVVQNRIHQIEESLKDMKRVVQRVYDRLDKQETLYRFYEEVYSKIKKLQMKDLFIIDVNTVKTLAYSKYPTSPWPYIDMIQELDLLKNETHALSNSIQNAGTHQQQEQYLGIVNELLKRVIWAIDFITKDLEYANQYNCKRQYNNETNMHMHGHHMPGY